jgi:glycerol kinase
MDGSKGLPMIDSGLPKADALLTKASAGAESSSHVRTESTSKAQRPPLNRFTTSHENVLQEYFIGAIDQGTTSSRFIIFDGVGEPVAMHQIEFAQHYPESG